MITKIKYVLCTLCLVCAVWSCSDNEDDIAINYYTSTKATAAGFLDERNGEFSKFLAILHKSELYSLLSTYGKFTVFAPTNSAIDQYMAENDYSSLDALLADKERCDTISRMHIIKYGDYYTTDYGNQTLPKLNMVNGYLTLSSGTDEENHNALTYFVNKSSRLVERDDSVTNGVVHIIDKVIVPSSDLASDILASDPKVQLFSQALRATGMADSLMKYIDDTYSVAVDSTEDGQGRMVRCTSGGDLYTRCYWPAQRYFRYTMFVETDSILKEKYGIETLDDLAAKAKEIYDQTYPADAGKYDDDLTNRKNPLNRFVSYHLLPRYGDYSQWLAGFAKNCWDTNLCDPEAFYETMCPNTMLRISSNTEGLWINSKRTGKTYPVKGSRVFTAEESKVINPSNTQQSKNGIYHYLHDIIAYTPTVRDEVLNCRIRIDATRLSPDFMNQNAIGDKGNPGLLTGFKRGFLTDWEFSEQTFVGVHSDVDYWNSFEGNAVCISGIFDVTFRLPPVPEDMYEIRLGYTCGDERGIVQVYLNGEACGIPVDLRRYGGDPTIGWEDDVTEAENIANRDEEDIINDKSMHNRGYMKGPACWKMGGSTPMRRQEWKGTLRRILTTHKLIEGQTYKLRFRQVIPDPMRYWSFDYIELCPKGIYAGTVPEDPF